MIETLTVIGVAVGKALSKLLDDRAVGAGLCRNRARSPASRALAWGGGGGAGHFAGRHFVDLAGMGLYQNRHSC